MMQIIRRRNCWLLPLLLALLAGSFVIGDEPARPAPSSRLDGILSFSPDGKQAVLSASLPRSDWARNHRLYVVSSADWSILGEASESHWSRSSIEWNPRDGTLVGILGGQLLEWDLGRRKWTPTVKNELSSLSCAKWAPDGKSLLTYSDGALHWLDADGQEKPLPKSLKRFRTIPKAAFDWTPRGDEIWIGYGLESQNCPPASMQRTPGHTYHGLYRIPLNGKPSTCLKRVCGIRQINVSPAGNYVATVIGGSRSTCMAGRCSKVAVFQAKTGQRIDLGKSGALRPVQWHPKEAKLLYVSARDFYGPAVFDLAKQHDATLPPYKSKSVWFANFHPTTGRVWAIQDDMVIELVDDEWQPRCRWDGEKFVAAP